MVQGHIDVQKQFADLMATYAGGDPRMRRFPASERPFRMPPRRSVFRLEANAKAAEYNARVKAAWTTSAFPCVSQTTKALSCM